MNIALRTRPATAPAVARPASQKALVPSPGPAPVVAAEQSPLTAAFHSAGIGVDHKTAQARTFDWYGTSGTATARRRQ